MQKKELGWTLLKYKLNLEKLLEGDKHE